jgi:hypothetical protein
MYREGLYRPLTEIAAVRATLAVLEELPQDMVIHRLTSDPHPEELVAPTWMLDRKGVRERLMSAMEHADFRQGSRRNNGPLRWAAELREREERLSQNSEATPVDKNQLTGLLLELLQDENHFHAHAILIDGSTFAIHSEFDHPHAGDVPQCLICSLKSDLDGGIKAVRGTGYNFCNSGYSSFSHSTILPVRVASQYQR